MSLPDVDAAYRACLAQARNHYENFPVASRLLPARLRRPVAAIYAFARTADDIADEGNLPVPERLAALDRLEAGLLAAVDSPHPDNPILLASADTIRRYGLPLTLFQDLISAFRQDVTKTRYADFGELMQYCRRSANPVGRLLLILHRRDSPRNLALSDAICSALQLINFYQDLHQDISENDRLYIPLDEMARFEVTVEDFRNRCSDDRMRRLLRLQYGRAQKLLDSGAPLGTALRGRFGLEIRTIILGGRRILQHLQAQREDLFVRPRLTPGDWRWMLWHALIRK